MKKNMIFAACVLVGGLWAQGALAEESQRELNAQIGRYEQVIGKLERNNDDLRGQIRTLQRANTALQEQVEAATRKVQALADDVQRISNVDLRNLATGQQQLAGKVTTVDTKLAQTTPWGEGQRDCTELGVKHQQIKMMLKPDGTKGVKFLCFDGRVLHLGSEFYLPRDEGADTPDIPVSRKPAK